MTITDFYTQEGGFVLSLLGGRVPTDDAEDIASMVWERVIKRPPAALSRAWLRCVVVSVVSDFYRARKLATPLSTFLMEDGETEQLPEGLKDRRDVCDQAITNITLTSILSRSNGAEALTDAQHRAVIGFAIGGLSMQELATSEGCRVPGMKLRIHRGREKLREAFA